MGLSDIAAGIEVVDEQRESGVVTVDRTGGPLADRLAPYAEELPCSASDAAALVEAYAAGKSVGASARIAGPVNGRDPRLALLLDYLDPRGDIRQPHYSCFHPPPA